jgi:hypothetical protein
MRGMTALMLLVSSLATAQENDLDKAKAYFEAGVEAYDQAKYDIALREFAHAHALSHSPALYFNMAACEEHLEHFQAAGLLLRQYLIEKPNAEDRANVELRIKSLEDRDERLHTMTAPPPDITRPAPAPPVVAPPQPKLKLKFTWIALGITGAVGVAAIGVGAYTVTHHDTLKSGCGATATGCSSGQIGGLKSAANATDALIAVTAVAAIATVVAAVVETRRARQHAAARRALAWDGAGVTF